MRMRAYVGMIIVLSGICIFAQNTDYLLINAPIGAQAAENVLSVKWVGSARPLSMYTPDSGTIYFDKSPGGRVVKNYRYKVTKPWRDSTSNTVINNIWHAPTAENPLPNREIAFRAADQLNMGSGVYYAIIAFVGVKDTFVSNEFQIIIESPKSVKITGPVGSVASLTPTFSWQANTGVPYYHVILSDDVIKVNTDNGTIDLSGVSIVWQAITPSTQIIYGAPDPSGTITADPPPLSPGKEYTWVVLNNYGNHPAFSSQRFDIPGNFKVEGLPLKKPVPVSPKNVKLNYEQNKTVKFKWTNLDPLANTYKIYVYVGQEYEGIKAQLIVWQTEVMADNSAETLSVDVNAASVFTTNRYYWRAIAVDTKGAGTVGDTVGFSYEVPTGALNVLTQENISGDGGTVNSVVGLVQIKVEVLDGSMEAPLLFYTDLDGYLLRERPAGTYRITAIKDEFESQTQTIVVSKNDTTIVTFNLERPEATIYGKVVGESQKGINLTTVSAVSDRGDTVKALTDALGNFSLKCYSADWNVWAEKNGYKSVLPVKKTVSAGQHLDFGSIVLKQNPFTLSGTVKNPSGTAILGVNVQLLQNNVKINEMPSTSEQGTFSFSVPTGTYTLVASKAGFTTYNGTVDITGSKNITVTLSPGATLVTGYVYGKAWVNDRDVIAPITGATLKFIKSGSSDSIIVKTDATYGDYKISLPGNQKYLVYTSANGYASKAAPCTLVTVSKTTQILLDTLRGLGMISGTVKSSNSNTVMSNVNVNIIRVSNGQIAATGKSNQQGYFEVRNIADGSYRITAGQEGYVFDNSKSDSVSLNVYDGKVSRTTFTLYLKPGEKTVKWVFKPDTFNGSIKIQSPFIKTLSVGQSLNNAGPGEYVITFDAKDKSVIDLAYHGFNVAEGETVHADTVSMTVFNTSDSVLNPVNGKVKLTLESKEELDSAVVYYKDVQGGAFALSKMSIPGTEYTFSVTPPKDGSTMLYYFKAWKGEDIYGYDKELYQAYISPDTSRLTRFEVVPYSSDTLLFPSGYQAKFEFKGYYSSFFIQDTTIDEQGINWSLKNPQGCTLDKTWGRTVTVKTGSQKAFEKPVILVAKVDTTKIKIAGSKNITEAIFRVSGKKLSKVSVIRIDATSPEPISTSGTEKAEFSVIGSDESGASLDVTPTWSISPATAGKISANGTFIPSRNFAGIVRVFADVNNIRSEYMQPGQKTSGLVVHFMMTRKSIPDTASNGRGCAIIFSPQTVDSGDIGLIEIGTKKLANKIERGSSGIKTIDSTAFNITELQGIGLNKSVRLELTIPKELQEMAKNGSRKFYIATWLEDSLKWQKIESKVSDDGTMIWAVLKHFSAYTIVMEGKAGGYLEVTPNPFSPYVWPRSVSPEEKRFGTAITFQIESQNPPLQDVHLRIYTITGEIVWAMHIQSANQFPYQVWWDGKTVEKEILNQSGNIISVAGDKMCRNGRYFVVLTAKDSGNKEQRFMKHVVLMK